jgi:hypothetical protein
MTTTLDYALPIGCALASFVGAWVSHVRAKDAGYANQSANAAAARSHEDANRVSRQSQHVHDLHDCVRQAVPTCPYAGPSSVSFDLPKVLDPEGRTGEVK